MRFIAYIVVGLLLAVLFTPAAQDAGKIAKTDTLCLIDAIKDCSK